MSAVSRTPLPLPVCCVPCAVRPTNPGRSVQTPRSVCAVCPLSRPNRGAPAAASAGVDETSLMHEWFELVHERSLLVRRDQLLQLQLRELELEDRHDRLQLELRERMATSGESLVVGGAQTPASAFRSGNSWLSAEFRSDILTCPDAGHGPSCSLTSSGCSRCPDRRPAPSGGSKISRPKRLEPVLFVIGCPTLYQLNYGTDNNQSLCHERPSRGLLGPSTVTTPLGISRL